MLNHRRGNWMDPAATQSHWNFTAATAEPSNGEAAPAQCHSSRPGALPPPSARYAPAPPAAVSVATARRRTLGQSQLEPADGLLEPRSRRSRREEPTRPARFIRASGGPVPSLSSSFSIFLQRCSPWTRPRMIVASAFPPVK